MSSSSNTPFPDRLREARLRRGLTQAELAARLDATHNVIAHLEQGRSPNAKNIVRIARALNVSADYLLGLSDLEDSHDWPTGPLMKQMANILNRMSESEVSKLIGQLNTGT